MLDFPDSDNNSPVPFPKKWFCEWCGEVTAVLLLAGSTYFINIPYLENVSLSVYICCLSIIAVVAYGIGFGYAFMATKYGMYKAKVFAQIIIFIVTLVACGIWWYAVNCEN